MDPKNIKLPVLPAIINRHGVRHELTLEAGTLAALLRDYAREAVQLNAPDPAVLEQADAWVAVCHALQAAVPDWLVHPGTPRDSAVAAIKRMADVPAKAKPAEPLPFDLEAAKAGAPLVSRDGRKARFLAHIPEASLPDGRVAAFIEGNGGATNHYENGRILRRADSNGDLFMAPKPKRTVWVNVYPSMTQYDSEAEARSLAVRHRIATVPVEIDA